jgi:glutamate-ammonia-ligase adenylyltransferase
LSNAAHPATVDARLALHSRFVSRIKRRYQAEAEWLAGRDSLAPVSAASLNACIGACMGGESNRLHELGAALRITRQLAVTRLAERDVLGLAPLSEVTRTMTLLAETCLTHAWRQVVAELSPLYGAPGSDFWVVGMGKLGARELNVSSDIDLVYLYETDAPSAGGSRGRLSAHEWIALGVRRLYELIGATTEHGFVFRVDTNLRPNGASGPPVCSLDMLEEYFEVQGREWERLAWLKSRVVMSASLSSGGESPRVGPVSDAEAGEATAGLASATSPAPLSPGLARLRSAVLPFVFRRYFDYNVFESLRELHAKIRSEAVRRAAGRPERANDVKLSRGGIREIEFIAQALQVVRGGQVHELRCRPTLDALDRLARQGVMPHLAAVRLAGAYGFLRQLEHRIQYLDDAQTHVLPQNDEDLAWVAKTMGFASGCELVDSLGSHREAVATEFDALLARQRDATASQMTGVNAEGCDPGCHCHGSPAPLADWPPELADTVARWLEGPRIKALGDAGRRKLDALLLKVRGLLAAERTQPVAVQRWLDWLSSVVRRESYLALLLERPEALERLLRLLGTARWSAQYLLRHPAVIDELVYPQWLDQRFHPGTYANSLARRQASLARGEAATEEALMDLLRHAHQAEVFRTLARDIEGRLTVEEVADDLSALADVTLRTAAQWCWADLTRDKAVEPRFGVVAYGKLGGKELGYGSDLDLVFVYDDAGQSDDEADASAQRYAKFVRKLVSWLSVPTGAGRLFEIDTALRPNGNSGLLVTRMDAFEAYQRGRRGSNTAWVWEHQAITRARFVAGTADLATRFDAVRRDVLCAPREPAALLAEVAAMRAKLRGAHPAKTGLFDLKQGVGGMIDVEFAVQALVLLHAARHPALLANSGNIALLAAAEAEGLLAPGVGQAAANAYRTLRARQHACRLDEQPTELPDTELVSERAAVQALTQTVFA